MSKYKFNHNGVCMNADNVCDYMGSGRKFTFLAEVAEAPEGGWIYGYVWRHKHDGGVRASHRPCTAAWGVEPSRIAAELTALRSIHEAALERDTESATIVEEFIANRIHQQQELF